LVEKVKPADTSYRHKDGVVTWADSSGTDRYRCHTDCSGLLNVLLKHAYGYKDGDLKRWFGKKRPQARDYHDAILRLHGVTRIRELKNARPGDVLAIRYPPGAGNTGHTMLVASPPRLRKASKPLVDGTQQWEVEVIDSSRSGHGPADTRRNADGSMR